VRIDFDRVDRWLRLSALVGRTLPTLTAAVFVITPGQAAETARPINDFPNYNQNAYCASVSSLHEEGSRAARLAQCRTFEASSRQRLSAVWSSIPPTARANCQNQIKGLSEGSYFLLSTCLVQEVANQLRSTLAQSARDFPAYKPDLYCGASVETLMGESRSFILNTCLENERESRTKLDRVWNEVPQDIKAICGKQMDAFKDGSYFLLSICVVSEVAKRWLDNGGAIN
jgi:hypothetical protein